MIVDRFFAWFVQHRAATLLLLAAATIAAAAGVVQLRTDDRVRDLLKSEQGDYPRLQEFMESFGGDDNECLVVLQTDEVISAPRIARLEQFVDDVKQLDGIESVYSILDARRRRSVGRVLPLLVPRDGDPERLARARREAQEHPLVAGQLLSENGTITLVAVRLEGQSLDVRVLEERLAAIGRLARQLESESDFRVRMTGIPALRVEIVSRIQRNQLLFTATTLFLSGLAATWLFRRPAAVVLAAAGPVLGLFWTMGLLGWLGQPITPVTSIVPPLVLVIGFTDSIHLVFEVRCALAAGKPRKQAVLEAVQTLWRPCGFTAATTAFGFGSLILMTGLDAIRSFGMACALGTMCGYASVMIFTPLLASTGLAERMVDARAREGRPLWVDAALSRLMASIHRHARPIAITGLVLTALGSPCWFWLRADNRVGEFLPHDSPAYQALVQCEEAFGGALFLHVVVDWPAEANLETPEVRKCLADVHRIFEEEPTTRHPVSYLSVLRSLPGAEDDLAEKRRWLDAAPPEALARFARTDQRRAAVTAHIRDLGGAAHEPHFRHIEARLAELEQKHPGFRLWLTGSAVVSYRTANQMIEQLAPSLGLAAILIFASMALLFGSLRLGLISLVCNSLPLIGASAFLVIFRQPLQYTSVMVFSVCIALAADDTVHFLSRFRRELKHGDRDAVVMHTMSHVGSALVVTTLVLLSGFASLLLADMPPIRLFGGLSCLVLLLAIVAELILLPALLFWQGPQHKSVASETTGAAAVHSEPHDDSQPPATATAIMMAR
jgi:predicted RND superfamily exporter protein